MDLLHSTLASTLSLSPPKSPFQPPSLLYHAITSPVQFWLSRIHWLLVSLRGAPIRPSSDSVRVVCISDTHTHTPELPPGDVLIHAGDLTNLGSVSEIQAQIDWLAALPYQYVVVIAGNHDSYFDPSSRLPVDKNMTLDFKDVRYLQHSGTTITFSNKNNRKVTVYGAPQIPECGGSEMAFQYKREDDAWSGTIPLDVDILVTHTPPRWHLDIPVGLGCEYLLEEVWRVRPRLHVFGHVHGGRGRENVFWNSSQEAYERVSARQGWLSMFSVYLWLDVVRVLIHDFLGIAWTWVWGAEPDATIMINAGVVTWNGKLAYTGQVVDI